MPDPTEKAWATELDRIIRGPVWPLLREWWVGVLVRRVLIADDPIAAAAAAATDFRGGVALMLAMENELVNKSEAIDGRRYRGAPTSRPEERNKRNGAEQPRGGNASA